MGQRVIPGGVDRGSVDPARLASRRSKKPDAPGVMKGKGKEWSTGLYDTPIMYAQGYTWITARQELGNKEGFRVGVLRGLDTFVWWPRGISP